MVMNEPLAVKMRPNSLKDVIGQEHLVGKDKILYNLVKNKRLFSMILYGKPGIGKTTIAHVLISELGLRYRILKELLFQSNVNVDIKKFFLFHLI